MDRKIGFIGTGEMGFPMAKNLIESGYEVFVFDINKAAMDELAKLGASKGASIKQIGEFSDSVIVMVRTTEQVEAVVLDGGCLLESCKPGSCIIIASTISPTSVQKIAGKAKEKEIQIVDAPVSGGRHGAEAGTLSMMVGGEKETYERVRPLLENMGKNIFHMGNVGMGEVAKLANNLLLLIQMNAAYEATALAEKAGLDIDLLRDLIKVSTGDSWVVEHWDMVASWKENYKPEGTLDLIYKDFQLALELALELKTPLHLGAVASQLGRY
ncbi:MAG: NAD(P)-dependent oxidoreductase [Desulfobacteraceae bacterium]|nr:NAD(P)-dependent oxidoreductase [Desulfobacteraceae bacterium]